MHSKLSRADRAAGADVAKAACPNGKTSAHQHMDDPLRLADGVSIVSCFADIGEIHDGYVSRHSRTDDAAAFKAKGRRRPASAKMHRIFKCEDPAVQDIIAE